MWKHAAGRVPRSAGRPRCSKCPDKDARDPLLALVEVIVIPTRSAGRSGRHGVKATVTKQAHLQKLAWLLHDEPGLLTGTARKHHSRWC